MSILKTSISNLFFRSHYEDLIPLLFPLCQSLLSLNNRIGQIMKDQIGDINKEISIFISLNIDKITILYPNIMLII